MSIFSHLKFAPVLFSADSWYRQGTEESFAVIFLAVLPPLLPLCALLPRDLVERKEVISGMILFFLFFFFHVSLEERRDERDAWSQPEVFTEASIAFNLGQQSRLRRRTLLSRRNGGPARRHGITYHEKFIKRLQTQPEKGSTRNLRYCSRFLPRLWCPLSFHTRQSVISEMLQFNGLLWRESFPRISYSSSNTPLCEQLFIVPDAEDFSTF